MQTNRIFLTLATACGLAACMPSQSAAFAPVDAEISRRLGVKVQWHDGPVDARVAGAVAAILRQPLDLDGALRVAFAMNHRLQAELDELGVARGQVADVSMLRPTEVDANYKFATSGAGGGEAEITVVQDVLDLIQLGQRRGIARSGMAAAQARAVAATVQLATRVELAFDDVVAAQQDAELSQTAFDAASASAEVAERMIAAGNTTTLVVARERAQREQLRLELAHSRLAVELARERLNVELGLTGDVAPWTTVARLPDAPASPPAVDGLEGEAVAASLDLQILHADASGASSRLGYARVRAWLPELGVGASAAKRDGSGWDVGPAIRLGLPLFNQQQGPRQRATAELHRAHNELTATEGELRAMARELAGRALAAHAAVRQLADVVLPLRQQILDETLLHYNAMDASVFELLMARRDLLDAGRQYVEALHRYWGAMAEVTALRHGALPGLDAATTRDPRSDR